MKLASSTISRRIGLLLLALLVGWLLVWDLRAVLSDQRPGLISSDTSVSDLVRLEGAVEEAGVLQWAVEPYVKGPMCALLSYPIDLLVGDALLSSRLLGVFAHSALLLLLALLALRISGGRWEVALLAVLISGTSPVQYGWFRMDFHDPLAALAVTATLLALAQDPTRRRGGLWLGLAGGFGLLTKLSYPVFVLPAGLHHLIVNTRSKRALINAAAAVALAGGLASLWLIPSWGEILNNLSDSTHSELPLGHTLHVYFVRLPGTGPLMAAGLAGAALAFWLGAAPGHALIQLLLASVGGALLLVTVFDPWTRYIVPVLPPLSLLAALGLTALGRRLPGRAPRLALAGLLVLGLLGQHAILNFTGVEDSWDHEPREFFAGMVAPDQRPHDGYSKAAALVKKEGWGLLELASGPNPTVFPRIWWRKERPDRIMQWEAMAQELEAGKSGALILLHQEAGPMAVLERQIGVSRPEGGEEGEGTFNPKEIFEQRMGELDEEVRALYDFVASHRRTLVATFTDPDEINYSVIRLHN